MIVRNLSFVNFRNLNNDSIAPYEGVNVIYGDNAQGKTNLLEAIWLFCGGHSFRSVKESEMIRFSQDHFKLRMEFFSQQREQNADIIFYQNKKQVKINGVDKNSAAYLTDKFSAVVFSPEHLTLIKRGPQIRRKFLDGAICRHKIRYATALSKYNRIINQRNSLLKEIYKHSELKDTLSIWDDALCDVGAYILRERFDYLKKLRQAAGEYHRGISFDKEELSIEYLSTCSASDDDNETVLRQKLGKAFLKARAEDIRFGNTSVGPHRDDMEILINSAPARKYASQGQQRSAVLSLKLAEAQTLYEKNGERPVVLLDDVLSELDSKRQDFLLNQVDGYQVFVTCCEESNKEQLKKGKVFYIKDGSVQK